jgi:hypothetical protein
MGVFEQANHDLSELIFSLLLAAQLANFGDNINTCLADDPITVVTGLIPVELEETGEELAVH